MTATAERPDTDENSESNAGTTRRLAPSQLLLGLGVVSALAVMVAWPLGSISAKFVPEVGREVFGNVPGFVKAAFYITTGVTVGVMFYLFSLRAKNWSRGQSERRTGRWLERYKAFERGVSMRTLLRDRQAGLMHSMVYFGFVVLFIGTVTLEVDNLLPSNLKFLQGKVYQGYSAVLDAASLVYLGGLGWAFVRRYVQRPWRLRSKTRHEDAWILATLAIIGVTGLATEAARIRVMGQPDFEVWSFVGHPLSSLVPEAAAAGWHQAFWVAHAMSFAAFLVVLPTTKLRHMVTSPANMFLSPKDRPKGAMKQMPNLLEAEDIDVIGASTISEFLRRRWAGRPSRRRAWTLTAMCRPQAPSARLRPSRPAAVSARCTAMPGNGRRAPICRIRAIGRTQVRSASTTASSW